MFWPHFWGGVMWSIFLYGPWSLLKCNSTVLIATTEIRDQISVLQSCPALSVQCHISTDICKNTDSALCRLSTD